MFSGFNIFGPKPIPTRFDNCVELKQISDILTRLRKKEQELDSAQAANGAGSPDYAKYTIIAELSRNISTLIDTFNEQAAHDNHAEEIQDMINLINALTILISNTLTRHRDTINIFRNTHRETAATTFRSAIGIASITTLFAAPFSLIPRIGMALGMGYAGNSFEEYTGLNSSATRTLALLSEFHSILREAKANLQFAIRAGRDDGIRQIVPQGNIENGLLYTYSPATREYIDSIRDKAKQINNMLDELQITEAESAQLEPFLCPILLSVMDIPVTVGGHEFDLDSLLALPVDNEDQRTHPFTRHKFFVRDIQPANKTYSAILDIIENIKQARKNPVAAQQIRPSAPALDSFGI